jgi:hypothetical protein
MEKITHSVSSAMILVAINRNKEFVVECRGEFGLIELGKRNVEGLADHIACGRR